MRYPNLYRGVRQLFFAELLVSVFISIIIFFPMGFPIEEGSENFENASTWILLGLGAAVTLVRVLALGQGCPDAESFRSAQTKALLSFGFFAHNLLLLPLFLGWFDIVINDPGVLNKELLVVSVACLPVVMQAAALLFSLSVSITVYKAIDVFSVRLKDLVVQETGAQLDLPFSILFCASTLYAILKAALPEEVVTDGAFELFAVVLLMGCILYALIRFLIYLKQTEQMLLHAKVRHKQVWTGVANELRPTEPDPEDLVDLIEKEPVVLIHPDASADVPDKWAHDKERFFPDPVVKPEELEEKDLRFPKCCQRAKRLFVAEILCLLSFVFSLLFSRYVRFYPFQEVLPNLLFSASVPPWFTSLAGKIVCYLQWEALRHVSSEEPGFARGEKILVRALWISFGIFLIPLFLYGLSLEPFDFKSLYAFEPFAYLLRVLWVITPVHVTLSIFSGLRSLAEKMRDYELSEHLQILRLRMRFVFYPLTVFYFLCVILETHYPTAELFHSPFCIFIFAVGFAALAWLWYGFIDTLMKMNQKLRREKADDPKRFAGSPIERSV